MTPAPTPQSNMERISVLEKKVQVLEGGSWKCPKPTGVCCLVWIPVGICCGPCVWTECNLKDNEGEDWCCRVVCECCDPVPSSQYDECYAFGCKY